MNELYAALIAAVISIIGAAASYLISFLKTKSLKNKIEAIEEFLQSDNSEYYVICPNCDTRIVLRHTTIRADKE